jgi:hypothetical protein
VLERDVVKGVKDDSFINGGAGNTRERGEGTIRQVAAIPKVNSSSVTMVGNELGVVDANEGQGVEVGRRVDQR